MGDKMMELYIDVLSNVPKSDQERQRRQQIMRQRFEQRLADAVERTWELPPIILGENGVYVELLLESRELFISGNFYSCVAMCGIVGERLIKDMFRASVLISKDGSLATRPTDATFDQLEHVEARGIVNFLKEAGLIEEDAKRAAEELGTLRNRYAHARGKEPHADAVKAIKLLHRLVEGTVSVFRRFDLKDGSFVLKASV